MNRPIGVFDSGKGGLTVLSELTKAMPRENYLYYGDIARLPFGSKTTDEILEINRDIISYLTKEGAKMIVLACNTSSAVALPTMKKEFPDIPIIGLIGPAASNATSITKNSKVGIFATEATINSHIHKKTIHSLDQDIQVIEQATPEFVSIVEKGTIKSPEAKEIIRNYLEKLEGVDTIIHGCTHYPYLEPVMKEIKPDINYVNPAQGVANLTKTILNDLGLLAKKEIDKEPETRYIVSKYEGGNYVRIDGRGYLLGSSPTN